MRQSRLFGKTLREDPKDEVAANARLLERGGFVYKSMAGVYEYLPLGLRVLDRINAIIREEMNAIGGQEVFFAALQPKDRWEKSGRWKVLGEEVMYRFKDHSGRELGLASTHEEVAAEAAARSIYSYKDLPLFIYQIQVKFRDELRAKSGLMRGREFFMKDLYSFHADAADLERFYWKSADRAYRKIFTRCGLDAYLTEASGGTFTKEFTHEYQVLSGAGEDLIFYCANPACRYAQNREIATLQDGGRCPKCDDGKITMGKSIEVGNIFRLGTRYAEAMGLFYADKDGKKHPVVMGSYGIGPGRVMATVVETHRDERGIMWPDALAPYAAHLIALGADDSRARKEAEKIYAQMEKKGIAVLYDDRADKTAGERFADADLIGLPWRVVVSEKTMEKKGVEIKRRGDAKSRIVSAADVFKRIS